MTDQNSSETTVHKWGFNRNRLFLAFNAVFALIFFGPLRDLIRTALGSEYDAYIPFIPFISAYLLYMDRQRIFSQRESSRAVGFLAMGAGILLLFLGRNQAGLLDHRDYQAVVTFAAVLTWIGGFALCYGIGSVRSAVFPLLFLFFMVPVPGAVLEEIILFLQTGSAEVSYRFFQLTGVPVARDGFTFQLPGIDVVVAKQCSGIRSSLSLVITGVLAAYLFLRTGWARGILILSIVPLAVVKNGIRIFTLSVLGVYWDRSILASDLHRKGGFLFFIIALILAGVVMLLLRKAEARVALKDKKV